MQHPASMLGSTAQNHEEDADRSVTALSTPFDRKYLGTRSKWTWGPRTHWGAWLAGQQVTIRRSGCLYATCSQCAAWTLQAGRVVVLENVTATPPLATW